MSLPTPPFIPIEGLPNFRDLGGYPLKGNPNKCIRRGVIFRAAEPSELSDRGIDDLCHLGIEKVYDLRSAKEVQKMGPAGVREWQGCQRLFTPIFLEEDYSPEAIALRYQSFSGGPEGFVKAYSRILALGANPDHAYKPFPTILDHLSSVRPPAPILIHCTAGKDRTGVICALILSLCGVSDEAVAHEYSLTDIGLQPRRDEIVDQLLASDALKGNRAGAESMISSRKESMLGTLAYIRERYGGVEQYITIHCRMPPSAVARLRLNLVVDAGPHNKPLNWQEHARDVERWHEARTKLLESRGEL